MLVNFYYMNKRKNSTLQPTDFTPTQYECKLKDNCSVLNPTLILDLPNVYNAPSYNYAQIQLFNRYYFVENWSYNRGLWTCDLSADVLASWKDSIKVQELYCLRTSNLGIVNREIIDNLTPTTVDIDIRHTQLLTPFISNAIHGTFVLGVINKTAQVGGVKYYAFTSSELAYIMENVFFNENILNWVTGSTLNIDITTELAKSIVNPFQYVTSAIYFPFTLGANDGVRTKSVQFGWWTANFSAYVGTMLDTATATYLTKTFSLTDINPILHPATQTFGNWVNSAPYTRMSLYFEPFGQIPLDPMEFILTNYMTLDIVVDMTTGEGTLYIGNDSDASAMDEPIKVVNAQVGVPIQLSSMRSDIVGAVGSALGGISTLAHGNVIGFATGIGNAVASLLPQSQSIGHNGNFSTYEVRPSLVQEFTPVVPLDVAHVGLPCCKNLTLANNAPNNFYQFADGDINIPAFSSELDSVKAYLEGGVFYE